MIGKRCVIAGFLWVIAGICVVSAVFLAVYCRDLRGSDWKKVRRSCDSGSFAVVNKHDLMFFGALKEVFPHG